jgi:hypothetical protein
MDNQFLSPFPSVPPDSHPLKILLTETAKEVIYPHFKKCYAQVASSVAHHVAHDVRHGLRPHSAGQSPIPQKRTASCTHGLRLKSGELGLIRDKATELGMNVNAYIRAKALGEDYIEKPPDWLRDVLLKLYVELAAQGNNLNQLTRKVNAGLATAESTIGIVDHHRQPVFELMKHIELALAGRKPPDDY